MLTAILWILGIYFGTGIALYFYSVIKSYEILGFWNWSVEEEYIGLCRYPKWLLGWMYQIRRIRK